MVASTALSSRHAHTDTVSISEASFAYLKTTDGMRDLALGLLGKVGKWITFFRPNERISAFSDGVEEAKTWTYLADLPQKFTSVLQEGCNSYSQKTTENLKQLFNKSCALLATITLLAEPICQRVYPITAATASTIAFVGNATYGVTRTFDATKNVHDDEKPSETASDTKEEEDVRKGRDCMERIAAVSDITACVLGVLSYTLSLAVSPWVLLAIDTNALACTLGAQFYPQIRTYSIIK